AALQRRRRGTVSGGAPHPPEWHRSLPRPARRPGSLVAQRRNRARALSQSAAPVLQSGLVSKKLPDQPNPGGRRYASIEGIIDADPVAACIRELMAERNSWMATAADLLRVSFESSTSATSWPQNPRALAGQLRRAQTFLRTLGIHIAFSREGRAGTRVINIRRSPENTVSTVRTACRNGSGLRQEQLPRQFG